MRLQFEFRGNELWCIEETAYNVPMLLMDEYYKASRYCMEHGVSLPQPPNGFSSQDETIIAIRISEYFVRMLTPAEIAVLSRNQPMPDE